MFKIIWISLLVKDLNIQRIHAFSTYKQHALLGSRQTQFSSVLEDIDVRSNNKVSINKSKNGDEKDSLIELRSTYDWSFIDKAYLITCPNADPGSERLTKAKTILNSVGLLDRVEVKEFQTDDEDRIRGCYTSHIAVMKDALKYIKSLDLEQNQSPKADDWFGSFVSLLAGSVTKSTSKSHLKRDADKKKTKCILVLEDNLEFSGHMGGETLQAVSEYLFSDKGADMIHLSYIPYVPNLVVNKTENKYIVSLTTGKSSALGTTAYVISQKAIERIVEEDSKYGFRAPIPDVMAEQFPNSRYSAYPTPFLRAPKTKSLVNPQLDNLREILFQPPVVSLVQNILAITGLSTNSLLFITVAVLLTTGGIGTSGVVDAVEQYISSGSYDGNIIFLLINLAFTTFSLGILIQGAALAPKPPKEAGSAVEKTAEVIVQNL
jgi:GR25 family glycosyltransferase involved in LPS biosynthesis